MWFDAQGTSGGAGGFRYLVDDGHGGRDWAASTVGVSKALPTDTLFEYQWGLGALNLFDAWDDYTGGGVKVAVREGGMDTGHPDIAPNFDPTLSGGGLSPNDGHATFVTGLVGAARHG